jgi:hypothetical protein
MHQGTLSTTSYLSQYNTEYFKELIKKYPELLLTMSNQTYQTFDNQAKDEDVPGFINSMYEALRDSKEVEPINNVDIVLSYGYFETDPIKSIRSQEFELALGRLMILDAVTKGNYEFFKYVTPVYGMDQISEEQLRNLKVQIDKHFPEDKIELLKIMLILHPMGKVTPLRDKINEESGKNIHDPEKFFVDLLSNNYEFLEKYFPSINNIGANKYVELQKMVTPFHFGSFAHAESNVKELKELKDYINTANNPNAAISHLIQRVLLASAIGIGKGSTNLNANTYKRYIEQIWPAVSEVAAKEPEEVYKSYLKNILIGLKVDSTKLTEEASLRLARICAMSRIESEEDANNLAKSMQTLHHSKKFQRDWEAIEGYEDKESHLLITYRGGFLSALYRAHEVLDELKKETESREACFLRIAVKAMALGVKGHTTYIAQNKDQAFKPLNFNLMQKLASDAKYIEEFINDSKVCFNENTCEVGPESYFQKEGIEYNYVEVSNLLNRINDAMQKGKGL